MSPTVSMQSMGAGEGEAAWRRDLARKLPPRGWRTRFAPAPTGYLHLGHLVNAIFVWGIARAHGGRVVLRIEDHDATRCRPEFERAIIEELEWLGFEADHADHADVADQHEQPIGSVNTLIRQSERGVEYERALHVLEAQSLVFPCVCTRREIDIVAPHAPGEEGRYPGTCRQRAVDPSSTPARRVVMAPGAESFEDLRLGSMSHDPSAQCGDVLVRDRLGQWTYQFSASVDDMLMAIDVVIRGEDLLSSTARQLRLARLLGRTTPVRVLHHPLLVHADGAKLSKANQDTALRERRARGERAESLIGEAAWLAGLTTSRGTLAAGDVASLFV